MGQSGHVEWFRSIQNLTIPILKHNHSSTSFSSRVNSSSRYILFLTDQISPTTSSYNTLVSKYKSNKMNGVDKLCSVDWVCPSFHTNYLWNLRPCAMGCLGRCLEKKTVFTNTAWLYPAIKCPDWTHPLQGSPYWIPNIVMYPGVSASNHQYDAQLSLSTRICPFAR